MITPKKTAWQRFQTVLDDWALLDQLRGKDPSREAAQTEHSRQLRPRLEEADRVGTSICPYCAVGCAQLVYAKGDNIIHIEGDPRSPINQGTLCPKGAATFGWVNNPQRLTTVKYRAPVRRPSGRRCRWSGRWSASRSWSSARATRPSCSELPDGSTVNHTLAIASLGGATLDNEENYLIKKLLAGGLGMVWVENQARI